MVIHVNRASNCWNATVTKGKDGVLQLAPDSVSSNPKTVTDLQHSRAYMKAVCLLLSLTDQTLLPK